MSWIVFSGPTLSPGEIAREAGSRAVWRGPAGHGDIYAAAAEGAGTMLLIDGYFDQQLSVWHKELLWALHRGVRVYGAASLGALRAVELAPFGMVGIGQVFEQFRAGILEDDDEVAVVHGPASQQYRPLSDAMVNIRASIACAAERGLLDGAVAEALVRLAKSQFYPERSLRGLVPLAGRAGIDRRVLSLFAASLENGSIVVDRKKLDALAALREVVRVADGGLDAQPSPPRFYFEYTEAWHEALRWFTGRRDFGQAD